MQVDDGNPQPTYSYVRPLATIEPTAIRLGMPVNTQIGFLQIAELQQALLQPAYAHSLIFVAWEHIKLYEFAKQMLQSYGTTLRSCLNGQTMIMKRSMSSTSLGPARTALRKLRWRSRRKTWGKH